MKFEKLDFVPVLERLDLVVPPVAEALKKMGTNDILVAGIDPTLADTSAFCEHYDVRLDVSANCVVLEAKRANQTWYVACVVLATDRIDVNGTVRRYLDARKISFAPMEVAIKLTGMEYGGITPIGLPTDWPILVDEHVAKTNQVIIGSGLRSSKLLTPGALLASLPSARDIALAINK